MSDYQRIKQTKYILGQTVYNKTLWRIRDYNRIKDVLDNLIQQSHEESELTSKTNKVSDPILNSALRREKYLEELKIIDRCLDRIPEEYRKGVWNNIMYREPYPLYADRTTYGRWKSKFIYDVAMEFEKGAI